MKKSEEIKKIIDRKRKSRRYKTKDKKSSSFYYWGYVYKIYDTIVNIGNKEIKIDDLEETIGNSKRIEEIKENLTDLILSDEKKTKRIIKFFSRRPKNLYHRYS